MEDEGRKESVSRGWDICVTWFHNSGAGGAGRRTASNKKIQLLVQGRRLSHVHRETCGRMNVSLSFMSA